MALVRSIRSWAAPISIGAILLSTALCHAAFNPFAVTSPMGGNGHNVTFDGRIFVLRTGPGWVLRVLRPERIRYAAGGIPVLTDAFTPEALIQGPANGENALALCEANADDTPYACNDAGARNAAGPYACYDLAVIDSNAETSENVLRRRQLKVWIANPGTADATLHRHEWQGGMVPLANTASRNLMGIEPTVTRDGRLLVWQGHPSNDGTIDILMYATNDAPCATGGWHGPYSISHMHRDPRVMGRYPLAERQLRAADGTPYADNALFRGAYPWVFPDGDAINFTGANMPCRGTEDPPGCGPRRNALSVIGYPTNWGLAHVDGAVNPSTVDTVRLFFSSPGPRAFPQIPLTSGRDVWPFFGSNTSNYGELVFDDALDGNYAGVWHMNESVNVSGDLDTSRTPDTSGYFNTGILRGAVFPAANNGLWGKALVFGGDGDHVEVPHAASLDPVNAISVEAWIRPAAPVDCDGNNNYRFLLGKGNIGDGSYSLVFEEGERFQARVRVGGMQRSIVSDRGVPVGQWSHVGFTFDGASGQMRIFVNGEQAGAVSHPAGTLTGSTQPLRIGGPGGTRAVCPNGDGSFQGEIDEVRVSRTVRDLTYAPRPGNGSRFVSQSVPPRVEAGRPFTARFTFRNTGTTVWSPGTQHRLGSQAPMDNARWGTGRVQLTGRIEAGATGTITATLTAPSALGTHAMQWQLVHEGAEWFGEPTALINVEVIPAGTDAGVPPPVDAGTDAGPMMPPRTDAGPPDFDGGQPPPRIDGGPPAPGIDAGVVVDGGTGVPPGTDGGSRPPGLTGGCSTALAASRTSPPVWIAVAILVAWRRRRRG